MSGAQPKRPCVTIERRAAHSYAVRYWQPRKRSPTSTFDITATAGAAELLALECAKSWAKLYGCPLVTIESETKPTTKG